MSDAEHNERPAGGGVMVPNGQRAEVIEMRRNAVARLYVAGYSTQQIKELLQTKHAITVSWGTVFNDIDYVRRQARHYFSNAKFDARGEVAKLSARYEEIIRQGMFDARQTADMKERALFWRVVIDAQEKLTNLYETCGLIDASIGRDMIDPEQAAAAHRPSGAELAKLFATVQANKDVLEGQLISEAERAWLYGDQAAANQAAANADAPPTTPPDQDEGR